MCRGDSPSTCLLPFFLYQYLKRKKDRERALKAFEHHSLLVFREYGDSSKFGGLVFDQIVEYGTRNGFGRKVELSPPRHVRDRHESVIEPFPAIPQCSDRRRVRVGL